MHKAPCLENGTESNFLKCPDEHELSTDITPCTEVVCLWVTPFAGGGGGGEQQRAGQGSCLWSLLLWSSRSILIDGHSEADQMDPLRSDPAGQSLCSYIVHKVFISASQNALKRAIKAANTFGNCVPMQRSQEERTLVFYRSVCEHGRKVGNIYPPP